MSIIPKEVKDKIKTSTFIKAGEFENGLDLEVVAFEIVKAKNPQYGATKDNYLVGQGTLKEGETFRYTFKTIEDKKDPYSFAEDRVLESASTVFFISFNKLDPDKGNKIRITRSGQGKSTKYEITRIEDEG